MNILTSDYSKSKKKACVNNDNFQKSDEKYYQNLYQDVNDVWNRNTTSRQFYTLPNTEIPNNQKNFSNWLYKINQKTCKEDPKMCFNYKEHKN